MADIRAGLFYILILCITTLLVSPPPSNAQTRKAKKPVHHPQVVKNERSLYTSHELAVILHHSAKQALPPDPTNKVADNPDAASFGQLLFFESRFSANGKISCATCHQPEHAYTDRRALSKGLAVGSRNTPTVINAAFNHWFFWDGRSDSLWSQALQPLEKQSECGGDRLHIIHVVKNDPVLSKAYKEVFGKFPPLEDSRRFPEHARPDFNPKSPLSRAWTAMTVTDQTTANRIFSNLGKAIEAYERKLIRFDSPFDRYVEGLRTKSKTARHAISPAAKRGLKLFIGKAKCELCHSGPNFTDGQFHNLGLPVRPGKKEDEGRAAGLRAVIRDPFNGMGRFSDDKNRESGDRFNFLPTPESQLGAFKTPSLRNVAVTPPYMHDGRFPTLRHVLNFYALGEEAEHGRLVGEREKTVDLIPHLTFRQRQDLISFLLTLTSKPLPTRLTEAPAIQH